jgi:hypothetical protein
LFKRGAGIEKTLLNVDMITGCRQKRHVFCAVSTVSPQLGQFSATT